MLLEEISWDLDGEVLQEQTVGKYTNKFMRRNDLNWVFFSLFANIGNLFPILDYLSQSLSVLEVLNADQAKAQQIQNALATRVDNLIHLTHENSETFSKLLVRITYQN